MTGPLRIVVAAVGWTGHAFPAFSLARSLRGRGHHVVVETFERWRGTVEELDLEFEAAPEQIAFGASAPAGAPSLAAASRELAARLDDLRPDAVVSDMWTLTPALAAELAGIPRATLIPHPYPRHGPGLPFYPLGLLPARTPPGRLAWRALWPHVGTRLPNTRLRRTRRELDEVRAALGLPDARDYDGQISEELALVATFPQLEYPREWPAHTHVTGPLPFELPSGPVAAPPGRDPLVLVAASTERDPQLRLIETALEALADEPVRVLATTNRRGTVPPGPHPANARVVDWLSYGRELPAAAAVLTHGGHGTIARALGAGVPALVCPPAGDMAENGARVAWAGAGLMLPRRLLGRRALRLAVRRLLDEGSFASRAGEIASWARANDGPARAARLVEELGRRSRP